MSERNQPASERKSMDPYQLIISLRAVRHFTGQPVPEDVLERILQAARWAGSAKNTQPWQFVVLRSRQTLQELGSYGPYASHLAGAALGIVIVTPHAYAAFDAGRVTQNMMLAAWTDGVGSCIASVDDAKTRALLGIPEEFQAHTAISFGYPLPDAPRTIEGVPYEAVLASTGRRPLSELIHWEQW
jgi:nitroreductase